MDKFILNSDDSISTNVSTGKLLKWYIDDKFIKTSSIIRGQVHV